MVQVGAAADVHVHAGDGEAMAIGPLEAIVELLVPDAVLRLLAAGVRLLAMAVAKARIDPQRDLPPRRPLAELVDHLRRAAIDRQAQLDDQIERLAVKNVRRIDDLRMLAAHGPLYADPPACNPPPAR